MHLPWGLVYSGDPERLPDSDDVPIDAYEGFWCLRYSLSTEYVHFTPDELLEPRPYNGIAILPIFAKAVFEEVTGDLPSQDGVIGPVTDESTFLQYWMRRLGPPLFSLRDCEEFLAGGIEISTLSHIFMRMRLDSRSSSLTAIVFLCQHL